MNFKRLTALALVLVMLLSFAACGGDKGETTTTTAAGETTTEAPVAQTTAEPQKVDGNLVASLKDGVLVDSNGTAITSVADGQKFVAADGKTVAEVKGDKVVDANGKTIFTVKDGKLLGADGAEITTEPTTAAQGADEPSSKTPDGETPTQAPAGDPIPTGKEAIFNFYKTAANLIKDTGAAGYTKKEWQELPTYKGTLESVVKPIAEGFMTKKDKAENQLSEKGSDASKNRFPGCTLTDLSKVASATCKADGENYKIVITMVDEITPTKANNFLGKVTNSILYWDDIQTTIDGLKLLGQPLVKTINSKEVKYKAFRITAVMTKDGKFVSLEHFAHVDIAADAKLVAGSLNATAVLYNYCQYSAFKY
ncbi:MAG: hypothetical protein GX051_05685 [Clostridiales bacterium]|nr:hypothetical protein [Clostridiales bacterium]